MPPLVSLLRRRYRLCAVLLLTLALSANYLSRNWGKFWRTYQDDSGRFSVSLPGGGFKHEDSESLIVSDFKYVFVVTVTPKKGQFPEPFYKTFSSKNKIQIQGEQGMVYEGPWAKEVCFQHNGFDYTLLAHRSNKNPDPKESRFFNSFRYY